MDTGVRDGGPPRASGLRSVQEYTLEGVGVLLTAATLLAGCSGSDSSPAADGGHSDTVRGWTPPQPAAAAKPLPAVPIVDSASQYAIDGEPGAFQFSASEIEGTNSCNVHPATGDPPELRPGAWCTSQ